MVLTPSLILKDFLNVRQQKLETFTKICKICKQEFPNTLDFFIKRKDAKSTIGYHCRKCETKKSTMLRYKFKAKCQHYLGSKCSICGYKTSSYSLDFHHKDVDQKDFCIASYKTRNFEKAKSELDKCILVCRNCHFEIHEKIWRNQAGISEADSVMLKRILETGNT